MENAMDAQGTPGERRRRQQRERKRLSRQRLSAQKAEKERAAGRDRKQANKCRPELATVVLLEGYDVCSRG